MYTMIALVIEAPAAQWRLPCLAQRVQGISRCGVRRVSSSGIDAGGFGQATSDERKIQR